MRQTHLWIEDPTETDGTVVVSAVIENPGRDRTRLWYRIPVEYRSALTKGCDPFVVATLFMAMREATDEVVHGEVSPSLLRNLEEFRTAWACWRPERYTKIEIVADIEREQPKAENSTGAIVSFSGGLDSCFTVWRHHTGRCGRLKRNIQAGVMVHGFDIPLIERDVFDRAAQKSARMLASLGIPLIPMATNFRELGDVWVDAFAAGAVSCLMMLQGGYTAGLFGSSDPYHRLMLPYGSSPVTDWMLSSDTFQFILDGAAFTRSEKAGEIANWPEALRYLRVCWQGDQKDKNCGRCEKCIRTILNFRVMGLSLPACFEQDVRDDQIFNLRDLNLAQILELEYIFLEAQAMSVSDSWVVALEKCIKRNRRAMSGKLCLRHRIRSILALRKRAPWLVKVIESRTSGKNK